METRYLIVGQGISGTMLSWFLSKAGQSCVVIDEARTDSASRVASGVINPVTGRRIVETWMINGLMPFAESTYNSMAEEFGVSLIHQKDVVEFFPSPQMVN